MLEAYSQFSSLNNSLLSMGLLCGYKEKTLVFLPLSGSQTLNH